MGQNQNPAPAIMVLVFRGSRFDGGSGTGLNQRKEERKNQRKEERKKKHTHREREKLEKEKEKSGRRKREDKVREITPSNTYGPHKGLKFTILPLRYVSQKLKTPIWFFRFSSLSLKNFEFWVMKTRLGNQSKQKKLCGSHVFSSLSYEFLVISLKIGLNQTSSKSFVKFWGYDCRHVRWKQFFIHSELVVLCLWARLWTISFPAIF